MFKNFATSISEFDFPMGNWSRKLELGGKRAGIRPPGTSWLVRTIDIVIALTAFVFFAPLLVAIAVAIRLSGGGPIFFAQYRVGLDGRQFRCFKFRTMCVDAEQQLRLLLANDPEAREEWARDNKLRKDPRVGKVGSFLRRTSLDELPQMLNVLRGDMSIVGPRPIVESEIVRYGRYFGDYCRVRPGITGLWQISGRNNVSYRRRVACDVSYARSKSAYNDLRIIALTVPAVLLARGAY